MKTQYLFPYHFKRVGWLLFIPSLLLGILLFIYDDSLLADGELEFLDLPVFMIINSEMSDTFFTISSNNIIDELIGILIIVGGILVAFSREKHEDEFISRIRLESLAWATYVNYSILLLAILFVYGFAFFWALVFNMFTTLIFFIIRFNWALMKTSNLIPHEEQN